MGTTKIIKIRTNPKRSIDYIKNPDKTDGKTMVSFFGCGEKDAAFMFDIAGKFGRRNANPILGYHIIQTFSPEDTFLTPEQAHKIGEQLMEELFHGKYAYICATHLDKQHLHNHFVICSSARDLSGKKINDDLTLLHKLQRTNDKLCRENGLTVITRKKGKGKKRNEWEMEKQNPGASQKSQLKAMIDLAISKAKDYDDFIKIMQKSNVEITYGRSKKYGTVTKYKLPDGKRCHRGYQLGREYSDDSIKRRIEIQVRSEADKTFRSEQKQIARASMTKAEKALDKSSLKIKHIINTSAEATQNEAYGLTKWKHNQNTKLTQSIEQELLEKYGIRYAEISGKINSLKADSNLLSEKMRKTEESCNNLRDVITACQVYLDCKRIKEYIPKSKHPKQYQDDHQEQLSALSSATSLLELNQVPLDMISDSFVQSLQQSLNAYETEQEKLRQDIQENDRIIQELNKAKRELSSYYNKKEQDI